MPASRRGAESTAAAGIGIALLAGCFAGCQASSPRRHPAGAPAAAPSAPVPSSERAKLPQATTYTRLPAAPLDTDPRAVTDGTVVHPRSPQVVYAAPGQRPFAVLPTTQLGNPTWVPVVRRVPGWSRILLPSRPNGATGWIYSGHRSAPALDERQSPRLVRIDTSARTLTVSAADRTVGRWTVAVGENHTPTPVGRSFLLALLAPKNGPSPLVLPLGAHSPTLERFGDGPGTVALHGWNDPRAFGQAVSHGCVRVPTPALQMLSRLPLGTLVLINR